MSITSKTYTPLAELIDQNQWHEFHKRSRSPFFSEMILGGPGVLNESIPFDHRIKHFGIFCDHVSVAQSEKDALREKALAHFKDHPEFLLDLMRGAYALHEQKKQEWIEANMQDLTALDTSEIAARFKKYSQDLLSFGVYVTLPLFVEDYFESFLKESFTKRFGEKADYYFGIAVDPIRDGTVLEEEFARLKLLANGPVSDEDWEEHAKSFGWTANTGFFATYYDAEHYRSLPTFSPGEATARLTDLSNEREAHRKRFNDLLESVSDDPYLAAVTHSANEAVFFRSYRTEMFYGSSAYNKPLLAETAKRLSLASAGELVWLFWNEAYEALMEGKSADIVRITERKEAYVYLSELDDGYQSASGDEAKALGELYEKDTAVAETKIIKGAGAFLGKVTGRAVVVNGVSELSKVQDGDVLVTHATNVDFVPAMRRASAIVTEEGGILSHAAIISRELRIPCVIGTKVATKIIKDGDRVEIDAGKGIVTIL